ncbi:hypothetical protein PVK06_047648 [Gossypium arboreum]|uniref:G-patch domain-containing protein n=1 Tax=Gossypium arboreum TaxID=29729 RepID=A0ABR0MDZ7_GOSAR|nr:hypothetical protein PVK06_047648 [Gossypium arboreum]
MLSPLVVRAFDGTKISVIGEIEIPLLVGVVNFLIHFQVMDITPSYSMLLGHPWIHLTKVATASYVVKGKQAAKPHVRQTANMLFAQTVEKGWKIHLGLGKDLQGISEPIFDPTQKDTRGLGYKPIREDVERMCKERKAKRLACMA